jgi:hypothetical protein
MLRNSLGFVLRKTAPALALRIDPDNDQILAGEAELMLRAAPTVAQAMRTEVLARRALRRSPISAQAVRMLATARDLQGDASGARSMMAYAERLSRRDLPTQLWLIQDAVDHNDIRGALHHYDIALRSSDFAQSLLFPVLEHALAQPSVIHELVQILAAQPVWKDDFLRAASREAQDLDGIASLLDELAARQASLIPAGVIAKVSARLVESGKFEPAWRLYLLGNPRASRAVRDPNFAKLGQSENAFDWRMTGSSGLSAEPMARGSVRGLSYRAAAGAQGIMATQLMLLPPGRYQLQGRADMVVGPPALLQLICTGGAMIASQPVSNGLFGGQVVIPPDCAAQWLRIALAGPDGSGNATGIISAVGIAVN